MTVEDIIARWGKVATFAAEVGCTAVAANHWRLRNTIPGEWYAAVSRAALARGFHDLTPDYLAHRAELQRLSKVARRLRRAA